MALELNVCKLMDNLGFRQCRKPRLYIKIFNKCRKPRLSIKVTDTVGILDGVGVTRLQANRKPRFPTLSPRFPTVSVT